MDNADFANDLVLVGMERILASRKPVFVGHSLLFCEGCDAPIPLDRRIAMPGCTQCVDCQSDDEMRAARHA